MKNKDVYVQYKDGHWEAKKAGNERASAIAETKAEITRTARTIAKKEKSELVIKNKDGKISGKDSEGKDPYPPKG